MSNPIVSKSNPSVSTVTPRTPTLAAPSAAPVSTLKPTATVQIKGLGFIIILKSGKGTLHAVLNPKLGPGALAVFEDVEQAVVATAGIPVCKTNEYFIIPVGGE